MTTRARYLLNLSYAEYLILDDLGGVMLPEIIVERIAQARAREARKLMDELTRERRKHRRTAA